MNIEVWINGRPVHWYGDRSVLDLMQWIEMKSHVRVVIRQSDHDGSDHDRIELTHQFSFATGEFVSSFVSIEEG